MKNFLLTATALLFGTAALMAQSAPAPNPEVRGRGRGGAPWAWNDKNKDGICDLTGKPVGQGQPGAGMRRGGGARAAAGFGRGARCGWRAQAQTAPPAQAPKQE